MHRPLIGITVDNKDNTAASRTYACAIGYGRAVRMDGGLPVLLPHETSLVEGYIIRCEGFILTGGVDPDVSRFGQSLHRRARPMDPTRQAFETALLARLEETKPESAVLGVCLGMQMMALRAGGRLDQYMPETLGEAAAACHQHDQRHALVFRRHDSVLPPGKGAVVSSHRQAVADPGALRVVATAPDGVIEAIDDPARTFYLGVQWHPERGDEPTDSRCSDNELAGGAPPSPRSALNGGVIAALVAAARRST